MGAESVRIGKAEQRAVVHLYRTCGCVVYENSDPGQRKGKRGVRGTPGRTPGIPDLLVFSPDEKTCWWQEVKAGKARLNPAQATFAARSRGAGVEVVVGDREAARHTLIERGIIRA